MQFTENEPQSGKFARSALDRMAEHGIPASPANFTVWYSYVSARDPNLIGHLDEMLEQNTEFTSERNQEIYKTFFGFSEEAGILRETGEQIRSQVMEIMSLIGQAGRDQSAYGEKLEGLSSGLDEQAGSGDVADMVRNLLTETREIMSKNQSLESRLSESSQQINSLQQNLEQVQREAMTDALTGIANRKYFDSRLRSATAEALQERDDICLLLMDIDHFKKFNDNFGHQVGDEALKVVARVLEEGVKGRDTPARYGGEEFAVILPATSLTNAVVVAEQIRKTLASRKLQNRKTGADYGVVTLSIGVAKYRFGESLEALVQRADEALYLGKNRGRNRVVAESELETVGLAS